MLCAVGTRVPDWVSDGYTDYARRLPRELRLELRAVPAADRRNGQGEARWQAEEAERLTAAAGADALRIALDERGRAWSSRDLADQLDDWRMLGRDVALFVGGPDGLAPSLLESASQRWSLSSLTLPHALVRVLVAEQIYRAWTLLSGHPYHR
jgi:23S rRNA (pseudouridine1915-N3)-methyltransferase